MDSNYVGAFQIMSNIYDFRINFSMVEPDSDENGHTVDRNVIKDRIVMSPALAKELSTVLTKVVSDYEKRFGQIPEVK